MSMCVCVCVCVCVCKMFKNIASVRETWVQSQVASDQRLLKWYLIPPCLTLRNIR